ncbi:MAG: glycosyltransferase [Bacteroidota bacterium]|nr:glycosyltransferase [Bacteroidota bacterium]
MRVTVSAAGRFHAFNLVQQLFRRGHLTRFITTTLNDRLLPNRRLPAELQGNADFLQQVVQIPLPEYLGFALRKLPVSDAQSLSYFVKDNIYDRRAAQSIPQSDLFVGCASQSLFQLREAKSRGARTIIERGSTHITEQYRLIEEERKRFGVAAPNRSRWDRLLEEKQLKEYHEADYIMVPSEFARTSFLARGFSAEKILKIRYGVDLGRFRPAQATGSSAIPTILFVGAIGFQKGMPYLLEAIQSLRASGVKLRLKLIGRMERDFESWLSHSPLRKEINEHIPFVANHELLQHFYSAQVFCLPSIQEGLALVIAEAMACGLPVIATENTGGREFIEDGRSGLIVPPSDSQAIAASVRSLIDDPARSSHIGQAAAEASNLFGWDAYGDAIERTYRMILDTVPPSSKEDGDEIASFYDEYWNRDSGWTPKHSFSQEMLDLHFKNAFKPTDKVLDVGCGDASNYQSWLVNQVSKLSAIDISNRGVANARRMGLDARVHDLSKPFPYPDASFNGAVCIEVLEHLYDPKFTVSEIFRVLAPGGLFVASVPNNGYFRERLRALTRAELSTSISDFSNEWKGAHIRFYSLQSFRRMLEVCGFEIESVRSNGDASIFDGLDALGGYGMQHATTLLRRKLPRFARLAFLENVWPSLFAPHIIVRARKAR